MKKILFIILLGVAAVAGAQAQGRGIDTQNDRVRDDSNNRAPGVNGANQSVGAGRGVDFGRGRAQAGTVIPNPHRFTARRDEILRAAQELMRERNMIVDASASRADAGILISEPYTFSRGTVVSQSDLNRYAEVPDAGSRAYTRGRYTLIVEIQPIDGTSSNVTINARIEGRTDGVSGAEWVRLRGNGTVEQEFLGGLVEKVSGTNPLQQIP